VFSTGEAKKRGLRTEFDRKVKPDFHGVKITGDAGLLAYRELDEVFGLQGNVCFYPEQD
jgi:hypothetical protein